MSGSLYRKLEKLVSLEKVPGLQHSEWFSLAPYHLPLLLRDMGRQ